MDKLLEFPKRSYATKQNPEVCSTFNEMRIVFQRLADQFWPGPVILHISPQSFAPSGLLRKAFNEKSYIGFRCPSHPLTVKVMKQVQQESDKPVVLVSSPVASRSVKLLKARDVNEKFSQTPPADNCSIQVLQGEERREIFAVPTCQFQDEWLECWIVAEKRAVVVRGKSKRDVVGLIKQTLRNSNTKDRVKRSVLQYWRVVDYRQNELK